MNEQQIKAALFAIYSAGFEAGYSQKIDICTAYDQWWEQLMREVPK